MIAHLYTAALYGIPALLLLVVVIVFDESVRYLRPTWSPAIQRNYVRLKLLCAMVICLCVVSAGTALSR